MALRVAFAIACLASVGHSAEIISPVAAPPRITVREHTLVRVVVKPNEVAWVLRQIPDGGLEFVETAKWERGFLWVGPPGDYALVVVGSDGSRKKTVVTISGEVPAPDPPSPKPPKPPEPPKPPKPDLGLVEISRGAKPKIRPAGRKHIPAIIGNFDSAASTCAAGGLRTIDAARNFIKAANRDTLGATGEADWRPFLLEVGFALDALEDDGRVADAKAYGLALAEIAEGLK